VRSLLLPLAALGAASAAHAQQIEIPETLEAPEPGEIAETAQDQSVLMEFSPSEVQDGRWDRWLEPFRVSLKHESSYKFEAPQSLVNNRSSVRLEYSKLWSQKFFVQLDTKVNLHWGGDHVADAQGKSVYADSVTREAYVQSSFGETSVQLGFQILVWGISEGGAITDEISPRNGTEFFFVSLEESRIGQPMLTVEQFSRVGEWSFFFVPSPAYNRYPEFGTEYYLPDVYGGLAKPKTRWADSDLEYGMRWKRTFGKSDVSLMAASLIDNDYFIRKQRFDMVGLTANIAQGNLLYRAEIGYKRPKVFLSQALPDGPISIVERDQLDSSLGFDYTPGGRTLTFGAEFVRSTLPDWDSTLLGRDKHTDAFVATVSNNFLNDDLSLTLLSIYNKPNSVQHKFLSSYKIDDNTSLYFELFYPDERDERSGTYEYRDEKQAVVKFQYQF
jgi:hypothetical protein